MIPEVACCIRKQRNPEYCELIRPLKDDPVQNPVLVRWMLPCHYILYDRIPKHIRDTGVIGYNPNPDLEPNEQDYNQKYLWLLFDVSGTFPPSMQHDWGEEFFGEEFIHVGDKLPGQIGYIPRGKRTGLRDIPTYVMERIRAVPKITIEELQRMIHQYDVSIAGKLLGTQGIPCIGRICPSAWRHYVSSVAPKGVEATLVSASRDFYSHDRQYLWGIFDISIDDDPLADAHTGPHLSYYGVDFWFGGCDEPIPAHIVEALHPPVKLRYSDVRRMAVSVCNKSYILAEHRPIAEMVEDKI